MTSSLKSIAFAAAASLIAGSALAQANGLDSAVARAWSDELYAATKTTAIAPMVAARRIGYFGVAVHESVIGARPLGRSLDGQLNGLSGVPDPVSGLEYFWPASANAAARRVLDGLFATAPQGVRDRFADVESALAGDFEESGVNEDVLARSRDYGRAVADAILAWSSTDGFDTYNNCAFDVPGGDGAWRPTPPAFRPNPLQPCWGRMRTFAIPSGESCDPGEPPPYSTAPDSECFQQARQVYDVVNALTEEQRTIARYWSDDPGTTGTPPGHWLAIAAQLMDQQRLDLGAAGEILARVGIAVNDAFISCWQTKYRYNLLRPVTYIQDHIDDEWLPILPTPPFPEYTSGHSTQSGAAAAVLFDMLGDVTFTDRVNESRGFAPRTFHSFRDAAAEAAVSRLYGGIHYDNSDNVGVLQGECVGREILARVSFDRCMPADIHPNGVGDGRVGVGDVALGWRKVLQTVALNARDLTCGDLHPGEALCSSGNRRNWCPEGDEHFTLADFLLLRQLALGRTRVSCQACPETADRLATAWIAGDVTMDGEVGVADAVRALRASVGLEALAAEAALRGDVAPALGSGEAGGDGRLDVSDAVALLRASVGLVELRWPARTLDIVTGGAGARAAFSVTLGGVPPWAAVASWTGEGCTAAAGDGLEVDADSGWTLSCVGDATERTGPGTLGSVTYVGPRAIDPASLTVAADVVDGRLEPSPLELRVAGR